MHLIMIQPYLKIDKVHILEFEFEMFTIFLYQSAYYDYYHCILCNQINSMTFILNKWLYVVHTMYIFWYISFSSLYCCDRGKLWKIWRFLASSFFCAIESFYFVYRFFDLVRRFPSFWYLLASFLWHFQYFPFIQLWFRFDSIRFNLTLKISICVWSRIKIVWIDALRSEYTL